MVGKIDKTGGNVSCHFSFVPFFNTPLCICVCLCMSFFEMATGGDGDGGGGR